MIGERASAWAGAGSRRALVAAGLLAVLVGALLAAWFASGWADVRARQRAVRDAPGLAAQARGAELAHELRSELATLMAREVERPYYHYQNLFHDPRGTAGLSVTPSPLAGERDALVLGYFQLDARGRTTTPTVNDELPTLSEPSRFAENRRFRDEVARSLAGPLAPRDEEVVAALTLSIDPSAYVQNSQPNSIFLGQQGAEAAPAPAPAVDQVAITITVSPLEWRTVAFAGQPAMVAVRQVSTPDGRLAQGFVVDRATLTSWLASRAGHAVAALSTGDSTAPEIAPGWHIDIAANPRAVTAAVAEAGAVARGFIARFVAIGVIAILAAFLVVVLVARAERLARERSQFAAAAAHELRTPLAGLQLYGDMVADGLGDPAKLGDYARRMSEEAARLGRVVANVLGFSQLERGNLSVDPQVAPLGPVLVELAERARPALERAGADLALDVAPELSARFDRDALARIIGNLLDNAEKYGRGATDRSISLAARVAGTRVEVVVSDRGPGIAASARARLFQPFARGVSADGPAGLGLGLALSQSLARAMGGDLAHRTEPGGGAAFVLTLTRAD